MSSHIVRAFDADLVAVRDRVMTMAGLVEQQLVFAHDALMGGEAEVMKKIKVHERQIDALQIAIDADCTRIITLRQPFASDLRVVLTLAKVINDLERIGNKVCKIARRHQRISASLPARANLISLLELASRMVDMAMDALAREDIKVAAILARDDAMLNDEFKSVERQITSLMMEEPWNVQLLLQTIGMAKAIERVGDHARNIAEYVVYLVEGVDVRHNTAKGIARITG